MARVDFRSRRFLIPAGVVLLLLAVIVYRVIQASSTAPAAASVEQIRAERGVPVTVFETTNAPLEVWREFSGNVSGRNEGVVRARTTEPISAVTVTAGTRVQRGQVLIRQAGDATAARARQAQAARNQAQRTVERLRPLHQAGAISDQEWEQATTQLELANADLAAARDNLTLTSPLAGTVTEVIARPGMIPAVGDPLVRVADLSRIVVYLRVSATDAGLIQAGQRARTTAGSVGVVERVALQADPETRLIEVEVGFPPGAGLIPGTLATVEVQVATREMAVQVPRTAVRDDFVWVVGSDDRAVRRPVQVGLTGGRLVEITSGLQPGERVVVEGGALLSDGAPVRVIGGAEAGDV
jgi:membrane fusion protein, multidrug efflux system